MKKRTIISLLCAISLFGAGCSKQVEKPGLPEGEPNGSQKQIEVIPEKESVTIQTEGAAPAFTMDEVSAHATKEDCWLIIRDHVYDVTNMIGKHPGGEAILQGCGKDATSLFESKPGSGKPHSDRANEWLTQLEIGTFAK